MAVFNFTRQNNQDCKQGATFIREITLRDENNVVIDLTGFTGRMQVRVSPAASEIAATVAVTINTSIITMQLTAVETAALNPWNYYYDLELANGSAVERLLEGRFEVTPEVTR